ncbi:MAG: HAD family hydrolase [Anaerolineales bacterium]|nr:HAD family hydrolase [Anaerolineales bacterium]
MIKNILFDFDGTLRHNIPTGGDVFTDYARTLGLSVNTERRLLAERWEHFYWASSYELRADLELHKESNSDFWGSYAHRRLVALGAGTVRAQELAPLINQYMQDKHQHESIVPAEVPGMLSQLKETGYRLGVVSNRDNPFTEELEKLGLNPYFDFSLAGGEVGSFKPETGIFQAALERMDAAAQETVYVGDNYFADVIGSRRAGLVPVLYDPRGLFPEAGCPTITSFDQLVFIVQTL